jgi:enoyl-[acyl-carrier protein] reductase II
MIKKAVNIPVIAAGGIGSGNAIAACMALGADGVQIGSLFASSTESSAHQNFKNKIIETGDGGTELSLKSLTPVRLIKNPFYDLVKQAEQNYASKEELEKLLGRGRAKKGMFEGDLTEGELEIGQVASMIKESRPVAELFSDLLKEYELAKSSLISF